MHDAVVTVSDNRAEELSAGGMKESSLLLTYQSRGKVLHTVSFTHYPNRQWILVQFNAELQLGASATASVTDQVSCLVNS
jgi:hypothetical protein